MGVKVIAHGIQNRRLHLLDMGWQNKQKLAGWGRNRNKIDRPRGRKRREFLGEAVS
jgi:hypothetical protein